MTKPAATSTLRVLPLLVFFDEEIEIRRNLVDIPRYRPIAFESALKLPADVERIVISGEESLLLRFYEEIRKPSFRLIALTGHRFHDPRLDALVYAYLPANTPHELLERTIDNALDHIHLIHVREQINERLRGVTREPQHRRRWQFTSRKSDDSWSDEAREILGCLAWRSRSSESRETCGIRDDLHHQPPRLRCTWITLGRGSGSVERRGRETAAESSPDEGAR